MSKRPRSKLRSAHPNGMHNKWDAKPVEKMTNSEAFEKDWARGCENCGAKPVVNATGLCGPCTFGEAETAGGNW